MAREGNDAEGAKPVIAPSGCSDVLKLRRLKFLGLPHDKAEAWWWFAVYRACLVFQPMIVCVHDSSEH